MNCIEITRAVLTGQIGADHNSKPLLDDVLYNNVIEAVTILSPLLDADERRSFDVEIIRDNSTANVVVQFDTYYFQFALARGRIFNHVFKNAKRLVITTLNSDNLVNVKLIY